MKTISKLRDDLLISEEEGKAVDLKTEGNRIEWDTSKDKGAEIAIGEIATEVIVAQLKKLDEQKKLTVELLPLWERFVEGKDESEKTDS